MPVLMPVYEKVETIVLAFLRSGLRHGKFGSLQPLPNGEFAVTTSGGSGFLVKSTAAGWRVQKGLMVGVDADLLEAARLAAES